MNKDKIVHPSDDLAYDVYNNIDYQNIQQEQTINNSIYTLADNELQLSSDLEDPNEADDQKSTNNQKDVLVIAYNTKAGNNTLHPKVFYTLYIKPYQSVPIPEDLIKTMNKIDLSDNKIKIDHFDNNQSVV